MIDKILIILAMFLTGIVNSCGHSGAEEKNDSYYSKRFAKYMNEVHQINIATIHDEIFLIIRNMNCSDCITFDLKEVPKCSNCTLIAAGKTSGKSLDEMRKFFNGNMSRVLVDAKAEALSYDIGLLQPAVLFHVKNGSVLAFFSYENGYNINRMLTYIISLR
jgi:hypothetical protein